MIVSPELFSLVWSYTLLTETSLVLRFTIIFTISGSIRHFRSLLIIVNYSASILFLPFISLFAHSMAIFYEANRHLLFKALITRWTTSSQLWSSRSTIGRSYNIWIFKFNFIRFKSFYSQWCFWLLFQYACNLSWRTSSGDTEERVSLLNWLKPILWDWRLSALLPPIMIGRFFERTHTSFNHCALNPRKFCFNVFFPFLFQKLIALLCWGALSRVYTRALRTVYNWALIPQLNTLIRHLDISVRILYYSRWIFWYIELFYFNPWGCMVSIALHGFCDACCHQLSFVLGRFHVITFLRNVLFSFCNQLLNHYSLLSHFWSRRRWNFIAHFIKDKKIRCTLFMVESAALRRILTMMKIIQSGRIIMPRTFWPRLNLHQWASEMWQPEFFWIFVSAEHSLIFSQRKTWPLRRANSCGSVRVNLWMLDQSSLFPWRANV